PAWRGPLSSAVQLVDSIASNGCGRSLVRHIELIDRVELELDFLPGFQRGLELRAVLRGRHQNLFSFSFELAAFVTGFDASFQRDAIGCCARCVAPRMAKGATAELEH